MRKCQFCGRSISECMGFVNAGDLMKLWAGEIMPEQVREFCGICDIDMGLKEMGLPGFSFLSSSAEQSPDKG